MSEEKAKLSKQSVPEKKSDAAKLPNAPPKTEKPPDKTGSTISVSSVESRKPEDKNGAVKLSPAEVKKADAPGTGKHKDSASASNAKKPDTSIKAPAMSPDPKKPDAKTDAATPPASVETKKTDTPANTPDKIGGKNAASVSNAEKSPAPVKSSETPAEKAASENDPKKPDSKIGTVILPTSADAKKPDAPANTPGKDTAPVSSAEKPGAAVKPPTKAADEKTPTLNKPVPPSAQKMEPSAKIMLGGKPHDPITPPKAADPPKESGEQKGVRVTEIFEDRLDYPDEKALNSLPIPKEGEGFSMRLHPAYFYQFLDHPFSVNREVKDYIELYESIRDNGINEPVKARPREKGGLELISGHRRHDIASRLNYPVPVIIAQVDDDTARVEVVDGNLHRMDIPTSELARAAKMKMEALARKAGRRSKMEQLTSPEPKKRTDQIVAEDMGISRNQVNRLVKINDLVPELKQQVDDKKLPFNTAVELAYLKPDEQTKVVDVMKKEQIVPSMAQATALKEASRHADTMQKNLPSLAPAHKVDENKITSIIKPKKEPELKVTFTGAELKDFFPGETPSVAEVKRVVFDALRIREEAYKRQAKRQAAKDAIKSPEH